jgi:hypothetical protein
VALWITKPQGLYDQECAPPRGIIEPASPTPSGCLTATVSCSAGSRRTASVGASLLAIKGVRVPAALCSATADASKEWPPGSNILQRGAPDSGARWRQRSCHCEGLLQRGPPPHSSCRSELARDQSYAASGCVVFRHRGPPVRNGPPGSNILQRGAPDSGARWRQRSCHCEGRLQRGSRRTAPEGASLRAIKDMQHPAALCSAALDRQQRLGVPLAPAGCNGCSGIARESDFL